MHRKRLQIRGFTACIKNAVGFLKCPFCGGSFPNYLLDENDTAICHKCKKKVHSDKFIPVKLTMNSVNCFVCDLEIFLTPDNEVLNSYYLCPRCHNIVSMKFGDKAILPEDMLYGEWVEEMERRAEKIGDTILFLTCSDDKDFATVKLQQLIAKINDKESFTLVKKDVQKAGLLIDGQAHKCIGFILWTDEKRIMARQIYIDPDERRKGYALLLMKYWVDTFVGEDFFWIERPNYSSVSLLKKLGYAKDTDDGYIEFVGCKIYHGS